ncbi:hypothetical protein BX666DRAFT_1631075 [Dichotomocladium elegans]|nr:hypothetical protein BX666DRAFT_1631075 [Dichotomocladium elegans]
MGLQLMSDRHGERAVGRVRQKGATLRGNWRTHSFLLRLACVELSSTDRLRMDDDPCCSSGQMSAEETMQEPSSRMAIGNRSVPQSSTSPSCGRNETVPSLVKQHLPDYLNNTTEPDISVVNTFPKRNNTGISHTLATEPAPSAVITVPSRSALFPNGLVQNDLALHVDTYDAELAFLQDQWISICITLSSLRHTYIAILVDRDDSFDAATFFNHADFPLPDNIAVSTFRVKPSSSPPGFTDIHPPSRRWSAIAPNSIEPDIDHEMLLALDEILVQIRQMETNMERLEHNIRNTIQQLLHYFNHR